MMAFTSFASGFFTAIVLLAFLLAVFMRLRGTRKNQTAVRGYLDLIADLSSVQREQVQEIRRSFLPRVAEIRESLRAERAELARLLFDEPPDRSRIHSVARQILLHQSDLENEVIEHILEEQELLTPSQKRKFYKIIVEQFSSGGLGVHDVKNRS
jgi:Spy/CpxP family protein refolding chaperone